MVIKDMCLSGYYGYFRFDCVFFRVFRLVFVVYKNDDIFRVLKNMLGNILCGR